MAVKILAQGLGTGSLAVVYTVPTGAEVTISTLVLVNVSAASVPSVRVTAARNGAVDDLGQTLLYNTSMPVGDRIAITEGWTMDAADVVRINAPSGIAYTIFGLEVTP